MKYYQISLDVEPEIIGVNGIYQVEINKKEMESQIEYMDFLNFFDSKNKEYWQNQNNAQRLNIPPISGKLIKTAKLTDIMGYTPNISFLNYLYSKKFVNILEKHNLPNFKTYKVDVENKSVYSLLYIEKICLEEIIYNNSIIFTGNKLANKAKYHSITNYETYLNFIEQYPIHAFEKVAIPKKYSHKDLISIQAVGRHFYSGKLLNSLLNQGITGIDYKNSIKLEFS